ncbi:hypothetical protein C8F04DRAFT_1263658 [Mycena alexandri]|uniref:Uncharacterized protein n=1 Tax=Mycena alexandri TaxID=1745969 RepID=A0AAD6SQL1_9AGAR|nr:hypothetical protein C8F04DRAFT_1263658 [Mycena alexandri]
MAPSSWADAEQLVFMHSYMPDYVKHQAAHTTNRFWPRIFAAFTSRFPEHVKLGLPDPNTGGDEPALKSGQMDLLSSAIQLRKKKIVNWFRYQRAAQVNRRRTAGGRRTTAVLTSALFRAKATRKRCHQPIEIFQQCNADSVREALESAGYFELNEENAAKTEDNWNNETSEEAVQRVKTARSERMKMRVQTVKDLYAAADQEERDTCERLAVAEKNTVDPAPAANPDDPTPQERQLAIDETSDVFGRVHEAYGARSGWKGISIWGGPNPRLGGELSMKIVSFGTNVTGSTFEDAHPDFQDSVLAPFQKWLRKSFPADVRRARALPVPPPAAEDADPPRKRKAKRMHKKKRAAVAPPAPTLTPQNDPVTPPALTRTPQSATADAQAYAVSSEESLENDVAGAGTAVSPQDESPSDDDLFLASQGDGDFDTSQFFPANPEDDSHDVNAFDGGEGRWSCGPQGPPSSPGTAAAHAAAERGGLPLGATYVDANIDPRLAEQSFTFTPPVAPDHEPSRPPPRPAFRGSLFAPTQSTGSPYAPSQSFFFKRTATTPGARNPFSSSSRAPSTIPTASPSATLPALSATAVLTEGSASPTPSATTGARGFHPTEAAKIALKALAVPAVMPEARNNFRPPMLPAAAPIAAVAGEGEDEEEPELPMTRPMTKPPAKVTLPQPAARGRGGSRGGGRGPRGGRGGGRGGRGAAAPTSKKVGRSRKTAADAGSAPETAAATDATPAPTTGAAPAADPVVLIHSITPLNRGLQAEIRRREAEMKTREAARELAAAAEVKRQQQAEDVARGFSLRNNPDGLNPIVTFLPNNKGKRERVARVLADGSTAQAPKKHTRGELEALKAAAALRAAAALKAAAEDEAEAVKKRRAANQGEGPSKRRKTKAA